MEVEDVDAVVNNAGGPKKAKEANSYGVLKGGGLGFRVWGLGFRVLGLGFRVLGLGFRVWGLGFGV